MSDNGDSKEGAKDPTNVVPPQVNGLLNSAAYFHCLNCCMHSIALTCIERSYVQYMYVNYIIIHT